MKVVQICVTPETSDHYPGVYALTDSGEIYTRVIKPEGETSEWTQVPGMNI